MLVHYDRSRRRLLKWSAASAAGVALSGVIMPNFGISAALAADLGEGDVGVLNYAYALEQLEAAFYTMVVDSPYADINDDEKAILTDIRDHEVEHRDFLKEALAAGAIPDLEVDFSAVDFTSRDSVLGTAMVFEDLGVGAYNGAGKLLENADYLLNMNSVSFAGDDVVDKNGLDVAYAPTEVLPKADPFIKTDVTANAFM
ncbi:MAG TPA: ferritin-like domain-containing protein [Devosia sp.]|jgi:hypothetical protein|uniref:ferritin-like domain-containing protein n=1 Tax=Devosia sp. TaxID=1871048 RepID=UPI002DDCF9DE|nr:ferritin-like domain-containing protein [Devosia sp.]HEV2516922.1 ferritin-like domain-containing protein [Devosia sp.]